MVKIIRWDNVNLIIRKKHAKDRALLLNLSGEMHEGQMLAVMGPTGCGKTSLINVLSGRVVQDRRLTLTGNLYYDESFINDISLSDKVIYVTQDDVLFSYLTVRETLQFAAYFYSPYAMPEHEIEGKVDMVLNELTLTKAANTIIGSSTRRGISGGEYKRVLIGKELMKSPSVIFLDEPTSGLDSHQAYTVMETMKTLARNGRIVVAVIHQPRSSIFTLFDRLLLLSEGQTMYFGPASEAVTYFAELGYECPQHFNPADFFLDLLSLNLRTKELEASTRDRLQFFATHWKDRHPIAKHDIEQQSNGNHTNNNSNHMTEEKTDELAQEHTEILRITPANNISAWNDPNLTLAQATNRWFRDFGAVWYRTFAETHRNYAYLVIRLATLLFFAALLSLIYQNIGYGQRNIRDRYGLLYFVLINQAFTPFYNVLNVFPQEKTLVSRELWSGAYKASSYYLARVMCELPIQFILPIIYSTIIYWSADLNPLPERFILFLVIIVLDTFVAVALGFCVSAVAPSTIVANAVGPPLIIVMLLFGGFYINEASLPLGSKWVVNLSLLYWGFQGLVINEFRGEHFYCSATDASCITEGGQVIESLSFQDGSVVVSILALVALLIGFVILGYIGLIYNREKYISITAVKATMNGKYDDSQESQGMQQLRQQRGNPDKEEVMHCIATCRIYG